MRVITIQAEYSGNGVLAKAIDENGNQIDSHYHSSDSWLLNDWGLRNYQVFTNDKGMTDTKNGINRLHHDTIYSLLKEPFILEYDGIEVKVNKKSSTILKESQDD